MVVFIVVLYLAAMLALGVWAGREKIKDADDYIVAGRRLPWYILAATLAATEVGGGSCMGVVEKTYKKWGLGSAWYIWAMALTFVVFACLAPVLTRTRCRTVPEFFRKRYGTLPAVLAAVLMIMSLIGLTAVQMIASGTVFSMMTGLDYRLSVLAAAFVVIAYTYLGGMWSVSLTDFVQWIFIVAGMAAAVPFALEKAGGLNAMLAALPPGKTLLTANIGWGQIVSLVVIYSTSFLVGQEAMQRLYSARDEREARRGALACSGFYLVFGLIPPFLGLTAVSLIQQGLIPVSQVTRLGGKALLPLLAMKCLPALLTGVLFAGLISATMSSADSNLLGAASIWANDLAPLVSGGTGDAVLCMRRSRRAVLVVGLASALVAAMDVKSIISALKFSFSLRAAGPFFPFVLGHFWDRGSRTGAVLSISGATLVVAVLQLKGVTPWGFDPIMPGLLVGLLLYVVPSFAGFSGRGNG